MQCQKPQQDVNYYISPNAETTAKIYKEEKPTKMIWAIEII